MATQAVTQAEQAMVRFLADRPSPEDIIAFHPSQEADDRFYELQEIERGRELTEDEQEELDSYLYLEHLMRLLKAEARRRIEKRAS
jgi:hypothetical protein